MIQVIYSPANQAYLIIIGESLMAIKNTKADVVDWFTERNFKPHEYSI